MLTNPYQANLATSIWIRTFTLGYSTITATNNCTLTISSFFGAIGCAICTAPCI